MHRAWRRYWETTGNEVVVEALEERMYPSIIWRARKTGEEVVLLSVACAGSRNMPSSEGSWEICPSHYRLNMGPLSYVRTGFCSKGIAFQGLEKGRVAQRANGQLEAVHTHGALSWCTSV